VRYSVRYECADKNWIVTDSANADQVMSVHMSKTDAYRQAYAEQARWRKFDPVAKHLARIRKVISQTLVVG
jgi:hypothetical protein